MSEKDKNIIKIQGYTVEELNDVKKEIYIRQLIKILEKKGLSLNQINELLDLTKDAFKDMPIT